MTTLNDFSPYPESEEGATVETMTRNALLASWANSTFATAALRMRTFLTDQLAHAFNEAATEQFDVAFLLSELAEVDPARAEAAAKRMWVHRFDGGMVHELTWEKLSAAGINPDAVADFADGKWAAAMNGREAA